MFVAKLAWLCALVAGCSAAGGAGERADVNFADFEGDDWGSWTVEGDAFAAAPVRGTWPDQQPVSGFDGRGLVNTYRHQHGTVGSATSPEFTVVRKRIEFLIGGGRHPREAERTGIELVVDGAVVRWETGENDEHLERAGFDVAPFEGRRARLRIVDRARGGWGHINLDSIVFTDRDHVPPSERELAVDRRYLWIPIQNGASKRTGTLSIPGEAPRQFEVELARERTDWVAFIDLERARGSTVRLAMSRGADLSRVELQDHLPGERELYHEPLRPQFHFTARRGWLNDPNGLVYADAEWHLFFQHNPFGHEWGPMHWGHAVSSDLVHWSELDEALTPDRIGDNWSGSAAFDRDNTSKLGTSERPPLVLMYTRWSSSPAQCIASSVDRGRTFAKYASNPVIANASRDNRDPRVLWYAPTKHWVAVFYLSGNTYVISTSNDLRTWRETSRVDIEGTSECPDLFELPLPNDRAHSKWILLGGNGHYLIGAFDGERFTQESGPFAIDQGSAFYASQTWNDAPEGRRVQIGWMNGATPFAGMPFNCQMSFPCELSLCDWGEGLRVARHPVREIASLVSKRTQIAERTARDGTQDVCTLQGGAYDIELDVECADVGTVALAVEGRTIAIDCVKGELGAAGAHASMPRISKSASEAAGPRKLHLRVLVDRTSIETFCDDFASLTSYARPEPGAQTLSISAAGGGSINVRGEVRELASSWR